MGTGDRPVASTPGTPAGRVLSTRALNRALLARQLLLERAGLSLTAAIERLAGLQTQYAPSGYLSLWSRLRGFRREALTEALERRRVVQATMMRVTIHMASARDYRLFLAGIRRSRRAWWLRAQGKAGRGVDMDGAARIIRDALANGPRRADELREALRGAGYPPAAWSGVGLWVDLVRVPPSGTWDRRRADLYGLGDAWVPPTDVTEEEGLEHLVRRYLAAFGPASVGDVAGWMGLPVGTVRPVAERVGTRRFRDERGSVLVDVPRAPLPDPETPAPVRFIPVWEATLPANCRRTQILPEVYRPRIFNTKTPHSVNSFLVDGAVAGTWRYEDGRIRVEPFEPLPRTTRREVEEEADRLASFHAP